MSVLEDVKDCGDDRDAVSRSEVTLGWLVRFGYVNASRRDVL